MTDQPPSDNQHHDEDELPDVETTDPPTPPQRDWTIAVPAVHELPATVHHARGVLPSPDTALVQAVSPTETEYRGQDAPSGEGGRRDGSPRSTRFRLAILVPAAIFILILVGFIAVVVEPSWFSSLRNQHIPPPATASTTTTTPQRPNGSTPTISALQPDHALPGQSITVSGKGIISSNGSITAFFGNEIASTRCPSESMCTVVVPPRPAGSSVVQLRLKTANGYSNGMPFRFS